MPDNRERCDIARLNNGPERIKRSYNFHFLAFCTNAYVLLLPAVSLGIMELLTPVAVLALVFVGWRWWLRLRRLWRVLQDPLTWQEHPEEPELPAPPLLIRPRPVRPIVPANRK